jgi:hypothetical protein
MILLFMRINLVENGTADRVWREVSDFAIAVLTVNSEMHRMPFEQCVATVQP